LRAEILIKGIVQGVSFRPFIYRTALENKLVGYVRNRGDTGVEIVVEGNETELNQFIVSLKEKKIPYPKFMTCPLIILRIDENSQDCGGAISPRILRPQLHIRVSRRASQSSRRTPSAPESLPWGRAQG